MAARRRAIALKILSVAAALVLVAVLVPRRPAHVDVAMARLDTGSITAAIAATGTVQAVDTVQIGTQVSGTIERLYVDYNAVVHIGEPLAKIDSSALEAALAEARAQLSQAEAARLEALAQETELETV